MVVMIFRNVAGHIHRLGNQLQQQQTAVATIILYTVFVGLIA
jgi:hypothetical protein